MLNTHSTTELHPRRCLELLLQVMGSGEQAHPGDVAVSCTRVDTSHHCQTDGNPGHEDTRNPQLQALHVLCSWPHTRSLTHAPFSWAQPFLVPSDLAFGTRNDVGLEQLDCLWYMMWGEEGWTSGWQGGLPSSPFPISWLPALAMCLCLVSEEPWRCMQVGKEGVGHRLAKALVRHSNLKIWIKNHWSPISFPVPSCC